MSAKSPRYAGMVIGVIVLLAAGILIGRGTNGKDQDAGVVTTGLAPADGRSPAETGNPDDAQARPDRQPPVAREDNDDRLRGGWGNNDGSEGARNQQVGTPRGPTKGPASGARLRPPRGPRTKPDDGPSEPEPEQRGGSDAVNA
jgi:hypothetical protein